MFATIVASTLLRTTPSRADFEKLLNEVQDHWTQAQVKALLGPPDDIWKKGENLPRGMFEDTVWCYGTHGHRTFPTLGRVVFQDGAVGYTIKADPSPTSSIISDDQLTKEILWLAKSFPQSDEPQSHSLHLIRLANHLRPLGKKATLTVLTQFNDLSGLTDHEELFWLTRALFTSQQPGGVFSIPLVGVFMPSLPADMRRWPACPIFWCDGIPVEADISTGGGGQFQSVSSYLESSQADWALRTDPIIPPADPFLVPDHLINSKAWPYPYEVAKTQWSQPPTKADSDEQVLNIKLDMALLAQSALSNKLDDVGKYNIDSVFETLHQDFLKNGGHWDSSKQRYVRKDGSFLNDDPPNNLSVGYSFSEIPDAAITASFFRHCNSKK